MPACLNFSQKLFPGTVSLMVLGFLWMSIRQVAEINWHERPNDRAMYVFIGYMVQHTCNSNRMLK